MAGELQYSSAAGANQGKLLYCESGANAGKLVYACCCAPCTCPDGLANTYTLSWTGGWLEGLVGGDPPGCDACPADSPSSPQTLTLVEPCKWEAYLGDPWSTTLIVDLVGTPPCYWAVSFVCERNPLGTDPYTVWTGKKLIGQTPIGDYTEWVEFCTNNIAGVSVSA